MKILHVSDFHYKSTKSHSVKQQNIVDKLISCDQLSEDIDLVIFSGDLVQSGALLKDFEEANTMVLQPLLKHAKIGTDRLIICAGNHDINRGERLESVVKYLDLMGTNEEINSFISKKDFEASCLPLNNYRRFLEANFIQDGDVTDALFSAHIRLVKSTKVGIVSISTAWRAIGLNDEGNLVFPTTKLDEALYHVRECDFRILVMHHSLIDFKRFNATELEDTFHKHFDLILSGHNHKSKDSIDLTAQSGVIKIASPAALTLPAPNTEIGVGTINFNFEDLTFHIKKHIFDSLNNLIYEVDKGVHQIPTDDIKRSRNKFRIKIKNKLEIELEFANDLLVSKGIDGGTKSFLDLCAEPVLKVNSANEINDESVITADFDWKDFSRCESNYLILGKGKCGKTVLLKKVLIEVLNSFNDTEVYPLYIDCKEWCKTGKKLIISKEIGRYYEFNRETSEGVLQSKMVLLLLDNFQARTKDFQKELAEQLLNSDNVKFIAVSDETVISTIEDIKINDRVLSKLYFHRLRKKHIKQLTKKVYNLPNEKEDEIVEKINSIFTKLSIPFNFWTVSLFLWIFKKDLNSNFQNDVELINLYIEKLLEKERLTVDRSSFGYDKYKRYLSNLAHYLLTEHHADSYCAPYDSIEKFTKEYLQKNPRYNITAKEVLEYVDDRGIIGKKNESYSFRLNGVFEYFIAQYMSIDSDFLKRTIDDNTFYLAFANEFELYAGFKRDDNDFLKLIYEKTKSIYSTVNATYTIDGVTPDSLLKSKMLELTEMKPLIDKLSEKLKNGLTIQEQDEIEEELLKESGLNKDSQSEVRQKEIINIDDSIESLEISLRILGSVYKNLDEISEQKQVYEIFDYIVNSACNWGFKLIDEIKDKGIGDLLKSDNGHEAKALMRLITNFIPTLVQSRLNEMVGHKNVEAIILEKIEVYKKNPIDNQYKLFVMHFLLTDIHLTKYISKLHDIIHLIRLPVLKYSSVIKMNYYLGFKTNDDVELSKELRNLLQKQQLSFDKESDLGDLHKNFSNKAKIGNLKKDKS